MIVGIDCYIVYRKCYVVNSHFEKQLRTVALGAADIGCLFLERLTPGGMAPVGEERGESVLPGMRRTPA